MNRLSIATLLKGSNKITLLGWTLIFSLALYYINHNALRYFNIHDEALYHPGLAPFRPAIIIHITGGMLALLIGPFQFISIFRQRYMRIHRLMGKIYLTSVFISGITSVYLAVFDNILLKKEFPFASGILGLALAWFITSGMAFWSIKNRNIEQHREWMVRSYVVTFGFVTFRLIFNTLFAIESFPFRADIGGFTAWSCWSVPLLLTECVLQAIKIRKTALSS